MPFKPMLAATAENRQTLCFPYLVSSKLDGIRCIVQNGVGYSRNLKPIRNTYIQRALIGVPDVDGELIVGSPTGATVLNSTVRGVMSADGEPDFKLYVFDTLHDLHAPFHKRLASAAQIKHPYVEFVEHTLINSLDELVEYEGKILKQGYEGIMLRGPNKPYKCGRATPSENSLWKMKQFTDGELLVTGVLQGTNNTNTATINAVGATERSTHQANLVPNGRVGTILGTDVATLQPLEISPGRLTHAQREYYWDNPAEIIGKIAKYKCFTYGSIDAPRFATFQCFRDPDDM